MNGREEKTSPLRLAWDLAMPCRADLVYILKDSCFAVIAALLFPDMEQGPAIVAGAQRSNVQVLRGTDKLMDRLAEVAASKELQVYQSRSLGPRRLSRWATPPGATPTAPSSRPSGPTPLSPSPVHPSESHLTIRKGHRQ